MTVSIDIDLNAKKAMQKIVGLRTQLQALDSDIGKLGDNFDLDGVHSDIDELDNKIGDLGDDIDIGDVQVGVSPDDDSDGGSSKDDGISIPKDIGPHDTRGYRDIDLDDDFDGIGFKRPSKYLSNLKETSRDSDYRSIDLMEFMDVDVSDFAWLSSEDGMPPIKPPPEKYDPRVGFGRQIEKNLQNALYGDKMGPRERGDDRAGRISDAFSDAIKHSAVEDSTVDQKIKDFFGTEGFEYQSVDDGGNVLGQTDSGKQTLRRFLRSEGVGPDVGAGVSSSDRDGDPKRMGFPDEISKAMNIDLSSLGGGDGDGSFNIFGKSFDASGAAGEKLGNIKFGKATRKSAKIKKHMGGITKRLKKMMPSMKKWRRLLALVLPMMIVMGVQAAGVAASMASIALAGAAIIGLGLGGHGENMAESMRKAKEEVGDLKKDLFEVFQPTMQKFAPIQAEFFDFAPQAMIPISDALANLIVFEDAVFKAFSGAANWVAELINTMAALHEPITQLSMRFGEIVGRNIIEFFRWLIEETSKNQDMLIQLGVAAKRVMMIIFNLSKTFSGLIIVLNPMLHILTKITEYMSSAFGRKVTVLIFSLIYLTSVVSGLIISMAKLRLAMILLNATGGSAILSFVGKSMTALTGLIGRIYAAIAAAWSLRAALIATGIGALVLGGMALQSMSSGGRSASSQPQTGVGVGSDGNYPSSTGGGKTVNHGDTYNVDIGGSPDNSDIEGVKSFISLQDRNDNIENGNE